MKQIQTLCRVVHVFALAAGFIALSAKADEAVSLAGEWRFALDRKDAGIAEKWFDQNLDDSIQLPGALQNQGFGDEITLQTKWVGGIGNKAYYTSPEYAPYRQPGNIKVPFWLQPDKHYVGAAWYQRDVVIPSVWKNKRVVLILERPHWETQVWVDEQFIGKDQSLSTPHEYDLGLTLSPGKHRLTVRVDNRVVVRVGNESCSVSEHTQGTWNGIVGRMELNATSPVWIKDTQVYPDATKKSALIKVRIGNSTGRAGQGTLTAGDQRLPVKWDENGGQCEVEVALGDKAELWDEFHPVLQRLTVRLNGDNAADQRDVVFGLRNLTAAGTQFVVNGRKLFVRATCECGVFPKTGFPPTDTASWKRIYGIMKDYGLNTLRFHCFTPPEAALTAADEAGIYCILDCAIWPGQASSSLGDGNPVDRWCYAEADRILKDYGNHPSFLFMSLGCEPNGDNQKPFITGWVNHFKASDPRRLFTGTSGWPELPDQQWHLVPGPRVANVSAIQARINAAPPETITDYRKFIAARNVPVIANEIGEWCAYPNLDEIPKYTGNLKAKNFEIFRDFLNARHMGHQARQFLSASGKLQVIFYKEEIEAELRTPGIGGFVLLDLHDFPGQGTAPVGVLDAFWDSKGYVTPEEYRRFCNSTVPLARLAKRVFTTDESIQADIEAAHFGPEPLVNAVTAWKLVGDDGKTFASGQLPPKTIPVDNGIALGRVNIPLQNVAAPQRCKLVVGLEGTSFENDWDVWVYPPQISVAPTAGVTVVGELNDEAHTALDAGGKVLLLIPPARVKNLTKNPVWMGFSTIFWNTSCFSRKPPTTMGILCDPKHPALAEFPTDFHSNWQWWYLVSRAAPMILDDLPTGLQPIVQVIDDWFSAHKLGLAFEAKAEKGRLLVCSIDLLNNAKQNPVAKQMLHSLLNYMGSDRFNPAVSVSIEDLVRKLFAQDTAKVVSASSEAPDYEAARALDGDPATIWHTPWVGFMVEKCPSFPHHVVIELSEPAPLKGISCLPRQDYPTGRIKDYIVQVSDDNRTWRGVARGEFDNTVGAKPVLFAAPVRARYLKLIALSGFGKEPFISLAELNVIPAEIAEPRTP